MHWSRFVTLGFTLLVASVPSFVLAQGKGRAIYVGGTVTTIEDKARGPLDLKDEAKLVFTTDKGVRLEIPWASVEEVEYGQKAGRRVVSAVLVSPVALFHKKREHFVTLAWKDTTGKEGAAVFRLDKADYRAALAIIKARTGKDITYQDEEAKKQMGGGAEK